MAFRDTIILTRGRRQSLSWLVAGVVGSVPLFAGVCSPRRANVLRPRWWYVVGFASFLFILSFSLLLAGVGTLSAAPPQAPGDYVSGQDFDLAAGNGTAHGMTWDGTYYRVVDHGGDKVYTYNSSGSYVSGQDFNMAAGNGQPLGITWNGTYYRVAENSGDKVYTYNSSGSYVSGQDFNMAAGNDVPVGMTWDGTYYRVVDSSGDKVYTYNSSGSYVSGQDFNLAAGNGSPVGMTWDGTYYRVVDHGGDKVYTYNSSGSYVSGQDFNLAAGNDVPVGMTWDGTYYRVVDNGGDKVYTYEGQGLRFSSATLAIDLANNTLAGGNVGMPVTATPASPGDTIVYSLSGTDASKFGINSGTGQITLASGTTIGSVGTEYEVTVTATVGAATATVDVTITVTGANTAPAFDSNATSRSVGENSAEGTNVGEPVTATDENGDELTYTLGGTDASKYDIDEDSGQITVGSGTTLDYETDNADSVTVTASDPFGATDSINVSITITDMNVSGDLSAPPNVQVLRAADNMSVTVSWAAPEEGADTYNVARQELVVQPSSSFFANTLTVASGVTDLSYVDDAILSGRTYEYRVIAVKDEVIGTPSDWFRTTPYETTYGEAPENLRFEDGTERDERREYWLQWDEVDGSSDYELEVNVSDLGTGEKTKRRGIVVSDATYFYTAYSRAEFRVRGRKQDADLCGSGAADRCYTGWTAWFPVGYTAPVRVELPDSLMTPMPPDAKVTEMRDTMEDLVDLGTGQAGFSVAAAGVLDFIVLAAAVIVGIGAFAAAAKRNLGAPGLGVAASLSIICLWLGYIMIGSPVEWPIIASIVLFVGGALSGLRVIGLVGR